MNDQLEKFSRIIGDAFASIDGNFSLIFYLQRETAGPIHHTLLLKCASPEEAKEMVMELLAILRNESGE